MGTKTIKQDKNGVKVRVKRSDIGSTVEADCSCFGHTLRTHNNPDCPALKKAGK